MVICVLRMYFVLIHLLGAVLENGHCYRLMAVFTGKGTKTGYSEARTRINQVCVATLRFMASTVLLLTTFGAGICQATSITISGHVIDTAGAAIAGAAVAFRSSGTEVLTDTDGSFSLEKSVNAISAPDYHAIMPKDGSIAIQGGKIRVNTTGSASVLSVKAYEINGRLLFQKQHALVSGENTFALPTRGSNLYICQITSGNHRVTVKHIPAVKLTTVLESSSRVEGITDSGKAITDFYLPGFKTRGFINEETKEIYVVLPNKSNVKAIRPIITYTGKSISPDSTGMLDFTNPVKYTITAFDGSQSDYSVIMQKSDLPVLYINTPNSVPINSKEVWIEDASYKLIDESGFILNGHMSIKGRGNTTMGMPKTPFNIKLPKNNDEPFLGMPSHRRWVLLANYSDKSLLRTDVAFKLGETLDNLKWTPRSRHIVLNLNEEYQGVYQLVEQIKIDPNRINIAPTISSTQPDGGYLLEIDTRKGEQFNFTTNLGVVFNLKDPDENMEGVFENVKMNIQAIEDVIYSDSFTDTATGYSKYIDVQTFVDWYLANEITKNNDAIFFSSVYLYYNPADKRIHMGPLWDFDISSGNIDYSICKSPEGFYIKDNTFWISRLFEDPAFVRMVKDRWDEKRTEIFELLSYIKNQAAFLNNAQELNFKKWDILGVYVWPNPVVTGSYDGEIQYLHSWLSSRLNWLDLNINLLD